MRDHLLEVFGATRKVRGDKVAELVEWHERGLDVGWWAGIA